MLTRSVGYPKWLSFAAKLGLRLPSAFVASAAWLTSRIVVTDRIEGMRSSSSSAFGQIDQVLGS
jgi:hypothetical protein